jgi:hypothetical protein
MQAQAIRTQRDNDAAPGCALRLRSRGGRMSSHSAMWLGQPIMATIVKFRRAWTMS